MSSPVPPSLPPPSPPVPALGPHQHFWNFWSLLTAGAAVRLLLALCACGVLWGCIAWAL